MKPKKNLENKVKEKPNWLQRLPCGIGAIRILHDIHYNNPTIIDNASGMKKNLLALYQMGSCAIVGIISAYLSGIQGPF